MSEVMMSPDCRDGKCGPSCAGGWDMETDQPAPCPCACHPEPECEDAPGCPATVHHHDCAADNGSNCDAPELHTCPGIQPPPEDFPPQTPCPGLCAYGACGEPGGGMAGCGGCCRCLGGCHLEWDVQQAYKPETKAQAEGRACWEAIQEMTPEERFTL